MSAIGLTSETRAAVFHGARGERLQQLWTGERADVRRLITWRRALGCVVFLCALVGGAFTYLYVSIDIPNANEQAKAESNLYLFSDGTRLARTGEINRESVPLGRVPGSVRFAFVAAENKDFYSDSGVSLTGTARGIANTLLGKGKQSGSTITQQYVKNYYLSQEQTVSRKVKELVISLKVDQQNSKDDILAGYINTSYYGRSTYGIQAAARAYYNKDTENLTLEEGAYLAALLQAPSQYDWAVASPEGRRLVLQRWNYVLDNMVEEGWLDSGSRQRARFPEPVAPKPGAGLAGQAGYLLDAAQRELMASGISEQELAAGGWQITTNIEPNRQRALVRAIATGLGDTGGDPASGTAEQDSNRQAGAVSVDPRTGRILALYGGRDQSTHYINNATRTDYQAGPAFEPVVLAAEMENEGRNGLTEVRETAGELGIDPTASGFTAPQATTLGLIGVSPLEMAGVYATFGNEGRKVTPSIVKSVQRDGTRTQMPGAVGSQAIDPGTADIVTQSLSGGAFDDGEAIASASGSSDDRKAQWFIAGTAELVTSIGLFGEDATTQRQVALEDSVEGSPAKMWTMFTDGVFGDDTGAGEPAGPESLSAGGTTPARQPS